MKIESFLLITTFIFFFPKPSSSQSERSKWKKIEGIEITNFTPFLTECVLNSQRKPRNLPISSQNADEFLLKFNNHHNNILTNSKDGLQTKKDIEFIMELGVNTFSGFVSDYVPGSSGLVNFGQTLYQKSAEYRIEEAEKMYKKQVNQSLIAEAKKIENEGDREKMLALINNDKNPYFEDAGNGTIYNSRMIRFVNKLREDDKNKMKAVMNEQEKRINKVYANQAAIYEMVLDLEITAIEHYESNKRAIEANNKQIQKNKNNIERNHLLIQQNALRTSILEAAVVNHEFRLSGIETERRYERSSLEQRIDGLESGEYDRLFLKEDGSVDIEAKKKLINETKDLKLRKEITETANNVSEWGQVVSAGLKTFMGDKVDPDIIEGIDYAVQAANIVGCFASGNIAGGVLQSIGVFGKGGGDPNTKLLQQLMRKVEQMRKEMHTRFDRLDYKVEYMHNDLSKRIDRVLVYMIDMHEDIRAMHVETMTQLYLTQIKIDQNSRKLECMEAMMLELIRNDVDICEGVANAFKTDIELNPPKNYEELISLVKGKNYSNCLTNLFNWYSKKNINSFLFDEGSCSNNTISKKITEKEIYNNLLTLWKIQWGSPYEETLTDAIFNSPIHVQDNIVYYSYLRENNEPKLVSLTEFINRNSTGGPENRNLKNPITLSRVSNYLLTFYDVMLIHRGNDIFYSLKELERGDLSKSTTDLHKEFITYSKDMTRYSIAQQSLMSGHLIIPYFFEFLDNNPKNKSDPNQIKKNAIDVIKYNPVLASNLANYWINQNFEKGKNIKERGTLISGNNIHIELSKKKETTILDIKDKNNKILGSIRLQANYNSLYNTEFLFNEDYYRLIELLKKLNTKLQSIDFISSLRKEKNDLLLSQSEMKKILINN